ncbi:OmpL47-type beta-barrel domain-containing protein [Caldalkalibacillus salinus]|uniref:OmpL47-type beta-barrel domain-containing protein n=1 Tax=Caldalkalibacillus salinus TaxID=2803787 RepID=UPI0019227678|nr:hypothetical protein [Caldalkalibacillus salinus]
MFTEGTHFTLEEEGLHEVRYYSVDVAGTVEEEQVEEVKIDLTAPTTTSKITDEWTNDSVTVELTATDDKSSVESTYYAVNGAEFTEGTHFTLEEEGIHEVRYYSVDVAGNVEEEHVEEVKIDLTSPTTTSNITDEWHNASFAVELTGEANLSGVERTYYAVNGGEFTEGTHFTLEEEGIHEVRYYSVDVAGNVEEEQVEEVKIDLTSPTTTSNITDEWHNASFTVELTGEDNLSGVESTYYAVNGGEFTEGTHFTIEEEGVHEVRYYSVDVAGNVEEEHVEEVKIDLTAPVVTWDDVEYYELGTELEVAYEATDNLSGVAEEVFTINGEQVNKGDFITLDQPGNYTLQLDVTDEAGWTTSLEKDIVVYVPADIEVRPQVVKPNDGIITVQVTLPEPFDIELVDLDTVTLNGVEAIHNGRGSERQAQKGIFRFDREDLDWGDEGQKHVEFSAYVDGDLVLGSTTVSVKQSEPKHNNKRHR